MVLSLSWALLNFSSFFGFLLCLPLWFLFFQSIPELVILDVKFVAWCVSCSCIFINKLYFQINSFYHFLFFASYRNHASSVSKMCLSVSFLSFWLMHLSFLILLYFQSSSSFFFIYILGRLSLSHFRFILMFLLTLLSSSVSIAPIAISSMSSSGDFY